MQMEWFKIQPNQTKLKQKIPLLKHKWETRALVIHDLSLARSQGTFMRKVLWDLQLIYNRVLWNHSNGELGKDVGIVPFNYEQEKT